MYFHGCNLHWLIDNEEVYNGKINISNTLNNDIEFKLNQEISFLKGRLEEKELFIDKLLSRDYDSKEANKVVATVKNY